MKERACYSRDKNQRLVEDLRGENESYYYRIQMKTIRGLSLLLSPPTTLSSTLNTDNNEDMQQTHK